MLLFGGAGRGKYWARIIGAVSGLIFLQNFSFFLHPSVLHIPNAFGALAGTIMVWGYTLGWDPRLIRESEPATGPTFPASEVGNLPDKDDPGILHEGSICQRCGERYRMNMQSSRPWLCNDCNSS